MSRPPAMPAADKARIVLSILAGEITCAEAARRNKVSETAIGNWKRQFLDGGAAGLEAGGQRPDRFERDRACVGGRGRGVEGGAG